MALKYEDNSTSSFIAQALSTPTLQMTPIPDSMKQGQPSDAVTSWFNGKIDNYNQMESQSYINPQISGNLMNLPQTKFSDVGYVNPANTPLYQNYAPLDKTGLSKDVAALTEQINYNTNMQRQLNTEALERAKTAAGVSFGLNVASNLVDSFAMNQYVKQVKNTKSQYETQKKVLDLNLKNAETLLVENLRENIADLDEVSAAKNVDIRSQGLTGLKQKGAEDLGQDIAMKQSQNALTKAAMDLQYKMNVANAKYQRNQAYTSALVNIGMSSANYFGTFKSSQ